MADAIDFTVDGGVLKTMIREVKADAVAPSDGLPFVNVHYEGTLAENGEVFDSSVFSSEIGEELSLKHGWRGYKDRKPEYVYGATGSPPEIPPGAIFIFEVELAAC